MTFSLARYTPNNMNLKPTHKAVKDYYAALDQYARLGITNEGAVRSACQSLLESCAKQEKWTLVPEYSMTSLRNTRISVDGALFDEFELSRGYWEAKDMDDDLPTEIRCKFDKGYPRDNILFQTPERAILWQNEREVIDADLTDPAQLVEAVHTFFAYRPQHFVEWEKAVAEFKDRVPALGKRLATLIHEERGTNLSFRTAFRNFHEKCCQSLNPNLSESAVEEMLIQHLLTERIFRTVFDNPDFTRRNVIANEIENVIDALTSQSFSRDSFLQRLDRFYVAIERNAATITDFSRKQAFLNTVYEQFFQGFSVEVADTHGIVYTPQPIVDFMVKSVDQILRTEFNRSLSDSGVHIIDPFVGTGNFIVRIMREISGFALAEKYKSELHCNEVMLLPYYIASMNIEHQFFERTGHYQPFEKICLVDTFAHLDDEQLDFSYFTEENAKRVQEQKDTPMFVIIGNPPYNMGQVNENDNNKNRKYKTMDKRVRDTYTADSKATLRNKLSDPYVKAIRWASDRIGEEGIVAFVTNSGFLDGVAFDGMRKHLAEYFDTIHILDLSGNVRKNPKLSGTTHNVFGIQVGVSINFFVKKREHAATRAGIFYANVDEFWRKEDKYRFLDSKEHCFNIEWQPITPDSQHTWLTQGLRPEFESFVPTGSKEAKRTKSGKGEAIFSLYSCGVVTSRDDLVYSFNRKVLEEQVRTFIEIHNTAVDRKKRHDPSTPVEDSVDTNDPRIKWSHRTKEALKKLVLSKFDDSHLRASLYRPFNRRYLYFDNFWNERRYLQYRIFPTRETETENLSIGVGGIASNKPFHVLITQYIADFHLTGDSQCFPFYTYDEDGSNRRENITDWALREFQTHYGDDTIAKWDIFHYVYALLHHPKYRERYAANLKLELPRLPYAPDFRGFANAGARLAKIHVGYEDVDEYRGGNGVPSLQFIETPDVSLDWRVDKMKLSKDKTQLKYNDYLTLDGIPSRAFDYRLGNRSALEWVIDQYRVKPDKRSGIVNDPNRDDDPQYIIRLIRKVITVSLETVSIVENLPELGV